MFAAGATNAPAFFLEAALACHICPAEVAQATDLFAYCLPTLNMLEVEAERFV